MTFQADLSHPPLWVESGGERVKVKSTRVMVTELNPDTQDEEYTMGFGTGLKQYYFETRLKEWRDTHTNDRHMSAKDVSQELMRYLSVRPNVFVTVALELIWADSEDAFMTAAVNHQAVTVDPTSSMTDLPFRHSRHEMMVWCILTPVNVRAALGKARTAATAPKRQPSVRRVPSSRRVPTLDPMRPCDSRSRAPNRYTRAEIEQLADQHGISHKGRNMAELCAMLKGK